MLYFEKHLAAFLWQSHGLLAHPRGIYQDSTICITKISGLSGPSAATGCSVVQVRMLADQAGELTKALGVELDSVDMLGNVRCKR